MSRNIIVIIISTVHGLHVPNLLHLREQLLGFYSERFFLRLNKQQLNKNNNIIFPAGPEFDDEASGCQQFHFMPRFVRFLPGKIPNKATKYPLFLPASVWWSALSQFPDFKCATKKKKKQSRETFLHMPASVCSLQRELHGIHLCYT